MQERNPGICFIDGQPVFLCLRFGQLLVDPYGFHRHESAACLDDSFEHVVVPFLSLGVSEIDTLILRSYDGSLKEYIDNGDYDAVLVCYVQSMIGEHDRPQSANYDMFTFE